MRVAESDKKRKLLQKDEIEHIKQAQQICGKTEEIKPSMTTASLNKQRQRIKIRLDKEAQKAGGRTLDAITHDLERANRALNQATRSMRHVKKTQQMVARGFHSRKKKYFSFRKATANVSRQMFNRHLGRKGEPTILVSFGFSFFAQSKAEIGQNGDLG